MLEPAFLPVNKKVYANLRKFIEVINAAGCSDSGKKYYFKKNPIFIRRLDKNHLPGRSCRSDLQAEYFICYEE